MAAEHKIEYGVWSFPLSKIKSGDISLTTSLLAAALAVDSLNVLVQHDNPAILEFTRNDPLYYYPDREEPIVFRVQNVERVAARLYRITATSTLGLLTEGKHYGGIYTGQTVEAVLGALFGPVGHSVKDSLKNIRLYGWLPIAAPRDNLARVLLAIGGTLQTAPDGTLVITTLSSAVAGTIGADRIYQEAAVKYAAPVTAVSVTEHQYIPDNEAEEQTLFEGSTLEADIVTFAQPMHTLRAVGVNILESGANYARLSAGSGTLYGKPYHHNTREVVKPVLPGAVPNLKEVKDNTLVSLVNSEAVANSLANYYRWRETINAPVTYQGEATGSRLTVHHPYDHVAVTACLESVGITMSGGVLKAQETMLVGFVPGSEDDFGYFDTRVVLTESGTWTVPEGVTTITVVLIGGGTGGYGGLYGEGGLAGSQGGPGGKAGDGGQGGKIYRFTLNVTPGQTFQVRVGAGGAGGISALSLANYPGKAGTATTFGGQSSDSGAASLLGFTDPITGQLFAAPGQRGVDGAPGGKGATSHSSPAERGGDLNAENRGGAPGESSEEYVSLWVGSHGPYRFKRKSFGGGGGAGGAALGRNGNSGANGFVSDFFNTHVTPPVILGETPYGGNGGKGADAVPTSTKAAMLGGGGDGGHGGGGGGVGGAATGAWLDSSVTGTPRSYPGEAGAGGKGTAGASGGDGAALIYYDSGVEA